MLLYDVTYPMSMAMDCRVPWSYLASLAKSKKNDGAVAVCINGYADVMTLVDGQWISERYS